MKGLVTGGGGFIGSNLVRLLLREGVEVRVLDDFSTGNRKNLADLGASIDVIEGDLRDARAVERAVKGVQTIFHLAALPSVARSVEDPYTSNDVNVTGTLRLLLAARDHQVERFVFSSSSSVYGDTPVLPKREDMTPMPLSPYALQKLTGEHYCRLFLRLYGLRAYPLRYFNVYGPRQNPRSQYAAVIPLFVEAIRAGQSPVIYGDGGQTRDFTFVEDVARANFLCSSAPAEAAGQPMNVGCGGRISIRELAERLVAIMGSSVKPVYKPPRAGDVRDSQADTSRARENIGWIPRAQLDEGLRRTVEWFTT